MGNVFGFPNKRDVWCDFSVSSSYRMGREPPVPTWGTHRGVIAGNSYVFQISSFLLNKCDRSRRNVVCVSGISQRRFDPKFNHHWKRGQPRVNPLKNTEEYNCIAKRPPTFFARSGRGWPINRKPSEDATSSYWETSVSSPNC